MDSFFLDFLNLEYFILTIVLVLSISFKIKPLQFLLIILHVIVIFLLNDVLFDPSYMGDQLRYLDGAKKIRFFQIPKDGIISSVGFSSFLFSIIPLPFIETVQSLSMINFIIYLFIYFILKHNKIFTNSSEIFYLIYPSLLLYSSVALREMFILIFMLMSVYQFLIKEKLIISVLWTLPLIFLKPQNFLMINMCSGLFFLISKGNLNKKIGMIFLGLIALVFLKNLILSRFTIPSGFGFLEVINNYRNYMYYENTGSYVEGYIPINNFLDFVFQGIWGFLYILLMPLPWEAENPLQLIQSIENIIIFIVLISIIFKPISFKSLRNKANYLKMMMIVSMSIYGMVVFNFGSASRYRFSFIVVFLIFYNFLLKKNKRDLFLYNLSPVKNK